MYRLIIQVGRLNKSRAPTKYFVKVPLVGRFISLVGVICWHVLFAERVTNYDTHIIHYLKANILLFSTVSKSQFLNVSHLCCMNLNNLINERFVRPGGM